MISSLDRKLLRDLWNLKGQLLAICFVIASGIATFVTMLSTMDSLKLAMESYYARYRFADAFAVLKRAPESLVPRLMEVSGVAALETRVVANVTLDLAGTKWATRSSTPGGVSGRGPAVKGRGCTTSGTRSSLEDWQPTTPRRLWARSWATSRRLRPAGMSTYRPSPSGKRSSESDRA